MLFALLKELNNWFDVSKHFGLIEITDNNVTISGVPLSDYLIEGQYFRIVGSVLNDGVYSYPLDKDVTLKNETFMDGAIWALAIPPLIIKIATDIQAWTAKYSGAVKSPYASESFGGYSRSLKTGSNDGGTSWETAFASELNKWRKI